MAAIFLPKLHLKWLAVPDEALNDLVGNRTAVERPMN